MILKYINRYPHKSYTNKQIFYMNSVNRCIHSIINKLKTIISAKNKYQYYFLGKKKSFEVYRMWYLKHVFGILTLQTGTVLLSTLFIVRKHCLTKLLTILSQK